MQSRLDMLTHFLPQFQLSCETDICFVLLPGAPFGLSINWAYMWSGTLKSFFVFSALFGTGSDTQGYIHEGSLLKVFTLAMYWKILSDLNTICSVAWTCSFGVSSARSSRRAKSCWQGCRSASSGRTCPPSPLQEKVNFGRIFGTYTILFQRLNEKGVWARAENYHSQSSPPTSSCLLGSHCRQGWPEHL